MMTDRREKGAGRELTHAAIEAQNSQDLQLTHSRPGKNVFIYV